MCRISPKILPLLISFSFFGLATSQASAQFETRSSTRLTHRSCGVSAADFNRSGSQDLAVALESQSIEIAIGVGDGTFQRPVVYQSGDYVNGIAAGILTSSGNVDIVVADQGANALSLFLGNGDGTFLPPTLIHTINSPGLLSIGDFNNDGVLDILVVAQQAISVLLGNGDGTFRPVNLGLTYRAGSAGVGDFNGDGILDLAVSAQKEVNALVILLGNGDGTFRQGASYSFNAPTGPPVAADFRGDGKLDLVVPGVLTGSAFVLLGNGDGTFQAPVSYQVSWRRSMAGRVGLACCWEMATGLFSRRPSFLRHRMPATPRWPTITATACPILQSPTTV